MPLSTKRGDIVRSSADPSVVDEGPSPLAAGERGARALGWVSLALGAGALAAAPAIARTLGLEGREATIRAGGMRELASGVLCLSIDPQVGVASRLVGDVMDVAALVAARGTRDDDTQAVDLALAGVLALSVLDGVCLALLRAERPGAAVVREEPRRDYGQRSGLPHGIEASRGLARQPWSGSDSVDAGAPASRMGQNVPSPSRWRGSLPLPQAGEAQNGPLPLSPRERVEAALPQALRLNTW